MGWHNLESTDATERQAEQSDKHKEALRALGIAARKAVDGDQQTPLKNYLMTKAHTVSFRPSVSSEEVAFLEGQRSLALQILKLAGEIQ